ncbi:hypothetical protein [Moorena producens]|uniref:hypothetical protein n=1 Tax=Moorena producens TaxID=1155739 RepID=UPI003C75CFA5
MEDLEIAMLVGTVESGFGPIGNRTGSLQIPCLDAKREWGKPPVPLLHRFYFPHTRSPGHPVTLYTF